MDELPGQLTVAALAQAADPLAPFSSSQPGSSSTYTIPLVMVAGGLALLMLVLLTARRGPGGVRGTLQQLRSTLAQGLSASPLRTGFLTRLRGTTSAAHALNPARAHPTARVEDRMLQLGHDLEELAQRLAVDMDARAARLESLIAQAQAAADRLEALDRGPTLTQVVQRPSTNAADRYVPSAPTPSTAAPPADNVLIGVVTGGRKSDDELAPGSRVSQGSAGSAPAPTAAFLSDGSRGGEVAIKLTGEELKAQIARLSAQGLNAEQIAVTLGQHIGKVELVLALRRM